MVIIAACQSKPEQAEDTPISADLTSITDVQSGVNANKTSLKKTVKKLEEQANDSTETDTESLDCYVWTNTYLATTAFEDQEGDQFELHIAITLNELENNDYNGTIHMYLSGCEEQMFKGTVTAKATSNYVVVYFDKDVEGMDDMFKKGDKLVQFEFAYGEYVASWFAAMNDYVDEYTVLSLANK